MSTPCDCGPELTPVPCFSQILVKVQTAAGSTPVTAMQSAIGDLQDELNMLEEKFRKEVARKANPEQQDYILQ